MNAIDDDLRARLLDGLPPRVKGMAEAIVVEWESAVRAVPELARLAVEDVRALVALAAEAREDALRRRWSRLHDVPRFELAGRFSGALRRAPTRGEQISPRPAPLSAS